jgi:hypothetical protein
MAKGSAPPVPHRVAPTPPSAEAPAVLGRAATSGDDSDAKDWSGVGGGGGARGRSVSTGMGAKQSPLTADEETKVSAFLPLDSNLGKLDAFFLFVMGRPRQKWYYILETHLYLQLLTKDTLSEALLQKWDQWYVSINTLTLPLTRTRTRTAARSALMICCVVACGWWGGDC